MIRFSVSRAQHDIVTCERRFLFLAAGRRWGKTLTAKTRIAYQTLRHKDFQYYYITPYYGQCKSVFEDMLANDGFRRYVSRSGYQPYPRIWLRNGSVIGFRSFERPRTIRGAGLNEVWVDEIQDISELHFWPVLRPLISDKRGTLILSGQFRGHNWYYEQFYVRGLPGPDQHPAHMSWRYPTRTGIAFATVAGKAELELVQEHTPASIYDQEYECVPAANIASVFPYDQIQTCISGSALDGPLPNRRYVLSVDLGRVVDPTAIVCMDDSCQVVYTTQLPLRTKHSKQAAFLARLSQYWNALPVVDTTGGATGGHAKPDEHIRYYRAALPDMRMFYWGKDNKSRIISALALGIQNAKLHIPKTETRLLRQLEAYEYAYNHGVYTYGAPAGQHDDYVAAIAQAYWAVRQGWLARTLHRPIL